MLFSKEEADTESKSVANEQTEKGIEWAEEWKQLEKLTRHRESFFLTPRLWENMKLLPFWRNNCLSSSLQLCLFLSFRIYTLILSDPIILNAFSFLSLFLWWLLPPYIFYYLSAISRYHNVEKRVSRSKTEIVRLWEINVNLSIFDMFLNIFYGPRRHSSYTEFTHIFDKNPSSESSKWLNKLQLINRMLLQMKLINNVTRKIAINSRSNL